MKLQSLPYRIYGKIYHRLKSIRGSHRLYQALADLASIGLEEIDPSNAKGIFEIEDWDNLIVLDACRYDLYREVIGPTNYRYTKGSSSIEFLRNNFTNKKCSDIICISANPHTADPIVEENIGEKNPFYKKYDVFLDDGKWSEEFGTVLPGDLVKVTKEVQAKYPKRKKLVWFMQPHHPFIPLLKRTEFDLKGHDRSFESNENPKNIWDYAREGKISPEEVWSAYKENLEYTMPHIENLVEDLSGKTILTSDHGNCVGENGLFSHPGNSKAKILRKAPWAVMKTNNKNKEIEGVEV